MTTFVTIGVPTRNRAGLLRQTLDTLLAQDYPNFELVVSDNASTDETQAVCRALAERDPRVRYERSDVDRGLIGNFNRVIELARGEYIVIAGDDDLYEANFLSALVPALDRDPNVVLSAPGTDWITFEGRPLQRSTDKYHTDPAKTPLQEAMRGLWDARGTMMMGVFRASVLRRSMCFRQTYKTSVDYCDSILVFELSLYGAIRWTPEVLSHKRLGGVSTQPVRRSFFFNIANLFALRRRYLERLAHARPDPRVDRVLRRSIALRSFRSFYDFRRLLATSLILDLMPKGTRDRFLEGRRRRRMIAPIQ